MKRLINKFAIVMVIGGLAAAAAGDITLIDDNATATFDLESESGLKEWTVDGVNHIVQQWFWYRIGGVGGESSIDTLGLDFSGTTDADFDGDDETLFARYLGNDLMIELMLVLTGGTPGSGTSDLSESIKIVNTSTTETLDFHFFQYCDFDLGGTAIDESVEIMGSNTAIQKDAGTSIREETVGAPVPSHYEVGVFDNTIISLSDGSPTTLGDVAGPLNNDDLTWAFQWDLALGPGGTMLISKDKLIVPEPAALVLLALGGIGVLLRRRRRMV